MSQLCISAGSRVAWGSADDNAPLRDVATGKQIQIFSGHTDQVRGVRFMLDGKSLFSGSVDATLKLWDVNTGRAVLQANPDDATACLALGRWWAFRGFDDRAVEFLEKARTGGAKVSDLLLARCDWNLNRIDDARREFAQARAHGDAPADYLNLCIEAADGPIAPAKQP